jgi:hypothetical protein
MQCAEQMRRRGWETDAYKRGANRCPSCIQAKKAARNDINSELHKLEEQMAQPTPENEVNATPVPIRQPTADQRGSIRSLIEKHFDDDLGCWIGEWDDQKVAEIVNVPRVVVEHAREAAYGPIRISTEQLAIRAELAAFRTDLSNCQEATKGLLSEIAADLRKLNGRLEQLEQRHGVVRKAS